MARADSRIWYIALCRNSSLDGGSPPMWRPSGASLEMRAGSRRPKQALVGVKSQPSSSCTLMLPELPAVMPRSKIDLPSSAIRSLSLVSVMVVPRML